MAAATQEDLAELAAAMETQLAAMQATQDELYLIISAIGILGLQGGFAMLETGVARAKNTKSILMKNLCDFAFGAWMWYLVGWGIYEGDNKWFSGADGKEFAMRNPDSYALFVQQFGFAVTGTTVLSGAVLSRISFHWYIFISLIFVGFIYPIAAHWAWSENGFLGDMGFKDFAGSGVVHMVGGIYGLVGARVVGPRVGRFVQEGFTQTSVPRPLPGHSSTLQVLGVFMLTMGWFFFNAGSSGGTDPELVRDASRALINSLLALSTSCTTVVAVMYLKDRTHHLAEAGNGVLAGLVAITGPCGFVDTWAACLIGIMGGLCYMGASRVVLYKLRIDDPLDAFAVHGACGALGVLVIGIFDITDGAIYSGSFELMLDQIVGFGVLAVWALVTAVMLFYGLDRLFGVSLDEDDQLLGLDVKYHEGYAYPEFSAMDVVEYNRTRDAATRKMQPRFGSESWAASESSIHSIDNQLGSFRSRTRQGGKRGGGRGRAGSEAGSEDGSEAGSENGRGRPQSRKPESSGAEYV